MVLRWMLAWAHLLALGVGLGAVYVRAKALRGRLDTEGMRTVFAADGWWAVAGALWLATGLWRLFGSTEKGTEYYFGNHIFWGKMLLFLGIVAMEIRPIVTLTRWRRDLARGVPPDTSSALRLARISMAQALMVLLAALAATGMARGVGSP
jgi:putative membrane protein